MAGALSSRWMLLAILATTFAVYAPTLADWFTGDDFWFLRAAQTHGMGSYIVRSLDFRNSGTSLEYDRYRPLYPIAWRLEYAVFGLHAFWYHAVVLALHLVCVAIVWLIARRLLGGGWRSSLAALIFGLHPAYSGAIAWIAGANRVFEALPYFAAMLLWMEFSEAETVRRRWSTYAASVSCFGIAALFHSSALTLALVLPVYSFVVAEKRHRAHDWRAWLPFAPVAALAIAITAIHLWVQSHTTAEQGYEWWWHQYANYGAFLGMLLQPMDPYGHGSSLRRILLFGQGGASLAMLALTLAIAGMRPRAGVAVFALVWVYASLLLDSTSGVGAQGRVMYATGAPFAIMLVWVIGWVGDSLPPRLYAQAARVAPYAAVTAILVTVAATYGRERGVSHQASANERFAIAIRRDVHQMAGGSSLYVTGAPRGTLILFDDSRLRSMLQLYYGEIQVHALTEEQLAQLEPTLGPGDRVYRYTR